MTALSKFSIYIAAVIIFVSWVISSTFVERLERDTETMDAVQSEQVQIRQFANLADSQRVLLRKIGEVGESIGKLDQRAQGVNVDDDLSVGELAWVRSFRSDTGEVAKNAEDLADLAARVEIEPVLDQAVSDGVERARALDADVQKESDAFEAVSLAPTPESDERSAENKTGTRYEAISSMESRFDAVSAEIVSLFDRVDQSVTEQQQASASRAAIASTIAYVFYIIGTAIGGLGQWVLLRGERNSADK